MTAQQSLVGLTSKKRLGTMGTWAAVIIGVLTMLYFAARGAKAASSIR